MKLGDKAPDFSLLDKDNKPYSLQSFKSKHTVLYFYPKDDTPGCTVEAIEFSKVLPQLRAAGAEVVGISGGTAATKAKFCAKHDLQVTLLTDPDFSVATAYGAYGEKTFMGRKFLGILRKTFILDSSKKVVRIFEQVKPEGHAEEVLAVVQGKEPSTSKKGSAALKEKRAAKPTAVKASPNKTKAAQPKVAALAGRADNAVKPKAKVSGGVKKPASGSATRPAAASNARGKASPKASGRRAASSAAKKK